MKWTSVLPYSASSVPFVCAVKLAGLSAGEETGPWSRRQLVVERQGLSFLARPTDDELDVGPVEQQLAGSQRPAGESVPGRGAPSSLG